MSKLIATATVLFSTMLWGADLNSAKELMKAQKYSEAEQALRAVLEAEPENAEARYELGVALLEQDKAGPAEEQLRKARESADSNAARVQVALARALIEQKKFDDAAEPLEQAAKVNPDEPGLHYQRGMLYIHRQDFNRAFSDFESASEEAPRDAYAHYWAGMTASRINRRDKMVNHFQTFVKLAPDAPEAAKVRSLLKSVN